MIPVAPIVDYMVRHDLDLAELFEQDVNEVCAGGHGGTQVRKRVTPEGRRNLDRWDKRLVRARKRGLIDAYDADEFCCHLLGLHPVALYGHAWFQREAVAA